MGQGQLIAGFEQAVADLAIGETCTVTLSPDEAYGDRDPAMVQDVPRRVMPQDLNLEVGMILQGKADDGRVDNFIVVSLTDETVKLDGNHPLAGKALTFDIELLSIG
jgi:peptidylprolyl isomerase